MRLMGKMPAQVKLVEVGPRDGLQNESDLVSTSHKIELIQRLTEAGLKSIEVGSFVSPQLVPQMADSKAVLAGIKRAPGVSYPVLVPNMTGLQAALDAGAEEIAIFVSASESFSSNNLNCSVAESLTRYQEVCTSARRQGIWIRGYISCVLGCPYEGKISTEAVGDLAGKLRAFGCAEISLGDTIGVGTPGEVQKLIKTVTGNVPVENLAVHFHDSYGQALANILAALESGISIIDSSIAGLGGCPFAPGSSGNIASEDLLYMLNGLEIKTGVELHRLLAAGEFICHILGRQSGSKVARAMASAEKKKRPE